MWILIIKKILKRKYKDVIEGLGTLKLYKLEKIDVLIKLIPICIKIVPENSQNKKMATDSKIEMWSDNFNSLKILKNKIKKKLNDKNSIIKKETSLNKI